MDRLCDEIIQLIFYQLPNPMSLTAVSKRFNEVSRDPYVRAHYFLTRHGHLNAMYWALGRGRVINERVIDILLSSGATLSRYLIQVAIHHYFRTTSHPFIKTTWTRSIPFPIFTHFLKVAADMYGDIPLAKGEDDGSVFASFLKESRLPAEIKSIKWEEIRDILDMYKFIPFHVKDNIMHQFPLALSIEPRLLPLAVANGFRMDSKYRDFVFRKMFEKPIPHLASAEGRTDTIVQNVRELKRLDPSMFLSRTVAAEVCMEAKSNEQAYSALKKLDQSGDLLFELSTLVEDLIKLFIKTRSITTTTTIHVLRTLFSDFPSHDPTVRLVLILTVFLSCSSNNSSDRTSPATLKTKFEALGLTPLTRKDIINVMLNPFIEKYTSVVTYAKAEIGLTSAEVKDLVQDVTIKCLEVGCKGKMLKRLVDDYPTLKATIALVVTTKYHLRLEDLPPFEDEEACRTFKARLCRDYTYPRFSGYMEDDGDEEDEEGVMAEEDETDADAMDEDDDDEAELDELEAISVSVQTQGDATELGHIGQDTLSSMIRQEEQLNRFSRRNRYHGFNYPEMAGKMAYPADAIQVGKWIKEQFGLRSSVTAIFMTHAIINDTIGTFLTYSEAGASSHVPITLEHFRILARLGRSVNWSMIHDIELGAEFFFSEEDYLNKESKFKVKTEVKTETTQLSVPSASSSRRASTSRLEKSPSKKRPRRSAAETVRSYAIPDSDDEDIADEDEEEVPKVTSNARKKKVESNLQIWIKELSVLLKEEQRKYKEKKKRIEKLAPPDTKIRVAKSEFFKSLVGNIRNLRKVDQDKRKAMYGPDAPETDFTEDDDDEYQHRNRPSKRRRLGF